MKYKFIILIFTSIIIKTLSFFILDINIQDYNNGFFNIIGLTYNDLFEYCIFQEYGYNYFIIKNNNFPVLFLSIFSSICKNIISYNKILIFIIITFIEIIQGLLLYNYLYNNYYLISKFSKSKININNYKNNIFLLIIIYWLNPISIYNSTLLSLGLHIELLLLLILLWISNNHNKIIQKLLPIFFSLLIYLTPNQFITLYPCLLYIYLIQNSNILKFYYSYQSNNFKQQIIIFKQFLYNELISIKNFLILIKFTLLFLITYFLLHLFSYNIIYNINFNTYYQKFIINNFLLDNNKDLNPYINIYWFLMSTIIPRFKFFFQLILNSLLFLYSINIIINIKIPIKVLLSQIFLIIIFKSNPTLINYIFIILLIIFDYFTLFNSKMSIISLISFIIWFISFSCLFFLRSLWIYQDRLNSNVYYFILLIGQFSILIFIGEWMKELFNIQKENIISNILKEDKIE